MRLHRRVGTRRHPTVGGQSGFTLLELLIVIAVLGMLSGVAVFGVGALMDRADETACAADERVLVTALEAHAATSGSYVDEEALVASGLLDSLSGSHDVVLSGDDYSIVPTGDCVTGGTDELAGGATPGLGDPTAAMAEAAPTTATTPPTTTTTTAPVATASLTSIAAVRALNLSTNTWRATATVGVTDDLGNAVGGARVTLDVQQQSRTGNWTNLAGASGTTDGSGMVMVSSVEVHKYPVPRIRFRVSSVSAPSLVWQQNDAWSEVPKP